MVGILHKEATGVKSLWSPSHKTIFFSEVNVEIANREFRKDIFKSKIVF